MAVGVAEEFAVWFEAFQATEGENIERMKTFSVQLAELNRNYHDASKDLERERVAARATQDEAEISKRQFEDLQQSVERSSFVLVLIDADADGYIFKDDYYLDVDGGRRAALDLRASVQDYLKQQQPQLSSLPIMVKAFANADGLSQLLVRAKIIKSPGSLGDFAKGFSQAYDISDFVLVGSGKDRADEKIKGVFEQFVRNPTCRHVIFGACHDNGYVRVLEKVAVPERVTLLHSFDMGREFGSLKFQSTKMETIFRTEHVGHQTSPAVAMRQTLRPENVYATTDSTWAARVGAAGGTNGVTVSRKIKDLPPGAILLNAAGQRVDAKLPQPPPEAWNSWDHKIKKAKMRYCRIYHLQPGGCKGGCGYSHGPLSEEEILVLRHHLRHEPCNIGLPCRVATCFYGHNCSCGTQFCKFLPEMHNVDVTTVHVLLDL